MGSDQGAGTYVGACTAGSVYSDAKALGGRPPQAARRLNPTHRLFSIHDHNRRGMFH